MAVDQKKFNIAGELSKIKDKEHTCDFRLTQISEELHGLQGLIKEVASALAKHREEYQKMKENLSFEKIKWILKYGNLNEFQLDQETSSKIESSNKKLTMLKERAEMLNEERKLLRQDKEDLNVQIGRYYRMMKMINDHGKSPLVTQIPIDLEEKNGNAVLTIKISVYHKDYNVYIKNDVYFKKNGLWYLDLVDHHTKASKKRSDAIDKLMTDYKVRNN